MKKLNTKKMIAQRGGLMIEALAMLGLIAVVTPTMYKKSAERTLEVEDINTATTMRTYLDAAEAYVNNNYASLMTESGTDKEIALADYKQYLPYGYQDKQLYDFGEPKVKIHKDGMNLTAFVTFPAKEAGGLGKERTSRIASLIGSNGGYVTLDEEAEVEEGEEQPNKARGVGGIWTLKGGEYDSIVGDVHKNSIVMASASVINDINGDELESDKYLSRIPEGSGRTPDYRNTMRTDIYMGGMEKDETLGSYGYASHSIRNISSLIVGAEKASVTSSTDPDTGDTTEKEDQYGLYISDGDANENKNAFIAGTLEAVKEGDQPMFKVDTDNLTYYGSLDLAKNPANNEVKIGTLGGWEQAGNHSTRVNGSESENYYFHGRRLGSVTIATEVISDQNIASIMNESRFAVGSDAVDLSEKYNISGMNDLGTRVMIEGGSDVKGPFVTPDTVDEDGNETSSSKIKYNSTSAPKFPVAVGSNMIVDGLLAARQVDAQHMRLATLSAGSENIDDASSGKWLNVNADGVKIGKTDEDSANGAYFSDNEIQIGTDWNNSGSSEDTSDTLKTDTGAYLVMRANEGVKNTDPETGITTYSATGGDILMGNGAMQMELKDESESGDYGNGNLIVRGVVRDDGSKTDDAKVVTRFEGGNVHLQDANLNVNRLNTEGNVKPVFSVRGNSSQTASGYDETTNGSDRNYDVAVHGKMLVTGNADDFRQGVNYLSVGGRDEKFMGSGQPAEYAGGNDALVSIVYDGSDGEINDNNGDKKNILTINPKKPTHINPMDSSSTKYYPYDDGRIYMRKGLIEATNNQYDYNKDLENASGVMMASRFVANNPTTQRGTDEQPLETGATTFVSAGDKGGQGGGKLYDTYMVNPAYTSVMNDIKLASRGGARLSDILPDFITKGIYLVTNSYKETGGNLLDMSSTSESLAGDSGANRSAFLGEVGAPACPPGYARVITVTPHAFPVGGTVAYATETDGFVNANQEKEIRTNKSGNLILDPLVVLNDQLYTAAVPDSQKNTTLWKVIMGYPYANNSDDKDKYTDENGSPHQAKDNYDDPITGNKIYWNLVPITTQSIAGYATTYCYFDRVGVGDRVTSIPAVEMTGVNSFHRSNATPWDNTDQEKYRKSLNDPQLEYNEVW